MAGIKEGSVLELETKNPIDGRWKAGTERMIASGDTKNDIFITAQ